MRRLAAVDLNGWRDFGALGWDPDDEDEGREHIAIVDGGVGAVVVERPIDRPVGQSGLSGSPMSGNRLVGGPQAILAPHGRGPGWGEVGASHRRHWIGTVLTEVAAGENRMSQYLAAALEALTVGAERLVHTIPDHRAFAEAEQGRFLRALEARHRVRSQLLWRSVAAFHEAIAQGVIKRQPGIRLRLLIHAADGVESQTLSLAEAHGFNRHLAPLRDGFGDLIWPELGLSHLLNQVEQKLLGLLPELNTSELEASRLPMRLLLGDARPGDIEILRRSNQNWLKVEAPDIPIAGLLPPLLTRPSWPEADATLVITPLAPVIAARLVDLVEPLAGHTHHAGPDWLARGALAAGRLIEKGLPHYLDRLEPIALAVLDGQEARFENLTPEDRHVPANKEFISDPMRGFLWKKGQNRLEVYVLKGAAEVRKWEATLDSAPARDVPVILQLRQTPGQSWAKLSIASDEWEVLTHAPIQLDWEALELDPRTPQKVLEEIVGQPPVVPERVIEPAHIGYWDGSLGFAAMGEMLGADLNTLYGLLHRSTRNLPDGSGPASDGLRWHPVGTDGDLPRNLPSEWQSAFVIRLNAIAQDLDDRIRVGQPVIDNRGFLCLTWCFTQCPDMVQDHILEALEASNDGREHPLLAMHAAERRLQQAAGRAICGKARVGRLLNALTQRERPTHDTFGALSFVLSRREEAPAALNSDTVQSIAKWLCHGLGSLNEQRRYKQTFNYLLATIGGLLRFREVERYAFVAGRDPVADQFVRLLETAADGLQKQSGMNQAVPRLRPIVADLIELLSGTGGDPDLLKRIDIG